MFLAIRQKLIRLQKLGLKKLFIIILSLLYSCDKKKENDTMVDSKYDPKSSLELMLLNDFAYDNVAQSSSKYDEIKEALKNEIAQNEETKDNELIWLGVSNNNSNLTYVVRKKKENSNVLSIISRGTIFSFVDIVEDLEVYKLTSWNNKLPSEIKISKGIDKALKITMAMTSQVFDRNNLEKGKITLKDLLTEEIKKNKNTKLFITGHSLGGAITTGMSLLFAETFYNILQKGQLSINSYNFAGQTIGNQLFKSYYNKFLLDESISFSYNRIINPFDVVPLAFNNLEGITKIGYPYSKLALLEVEILIKSIKTVLSLPSNKYTHVGGLPIVLDAGLPGAKCEKNVRNLKTFSCWAIYEHESLNYIRLLKKNKSHSTEF